MAAIPNVSAFFAPLPPVGENTDQSQTTADNGGAEDGGNNEPDVNGVPTTAGAPWSQSPQSDMIGVGVPGELDIGSMFDNPNMDVNALVLLALLTAYKDGQEDLKFYANRVLFLTNLKKQYRKESDAANKFLSEHQMPSVGGEDNNQLNAAFQPTGEYNTVFNGVDTTPQLLTAQDAPNGQLPAATGAGGPEASAPAPSAPAPSAPVAPGSVKWVDAKSVSFDPPLEAPVDQSGTQTPQVWNVVQTAGGYYVAENSGGRKAGEMEYRVFAPGADGKPGKQIQQVWGDPHINAGDALYEAGNTCNVATDFTMLLPDGTQIIAATAPSEGNPGQTVVSQLDVVSGTDHVWFTGTTTSGHDPLKDGASFAASASSQDNLFFKTDVNGQLAMRKDNGWERVLSAQTNTLADTIKTGGPGSASAPTSAQQGSAQGQGQGTIATKSELNAYIDHLKNVNDSLTDDSETARLDLQKMTQDQSTLLTMITNFLKGNFDTAMSIARNV